MKIDRIFSLSDRTYLGWMDIVRADSRTGMGDIILSCLVNSTTDIDCLVAAPWATEAKSRSR